MQPANGTERLNYLCLCSRWHGVFIVEHVVEICINSHIMFWFSNCTYGSFSRTISEKGPFYFCDWNSFVLWSATIPVPSPGSQSVLYLARRRRCCNESDTVTTVPTRIHQWYGAFIRTTSSTNPFAFNPIKEKQDSNQMHFVFVSGTVSDKRFSLVLLSQGSPFTPSSTRRRGQYIVLAAALTNVLLGDIGWCSAYGLALGED